MKCHYKTLNGRLLVEVEGSTIKELFEQIGPVAEVLSGDDVCGKCASPHIYPRARTADKFVYYELVCSDCGAKLSFGQHKDGGTLWAKRTDEHGNAMDHRGWSVYLGIAAPKGVPPPARPTVGATGSRLPALLKRCSSPEATAEVIGEVVSAIEGKSSEMLADQVWYEAVKKHGDPRDLPTALGPVLGFLLDALDRYERGTV